MNHREHVPYQKDQVRKHPVTADHDDRQVENPAESTASIWRSMAAAPPSTPPDQDELAAGQRTPGRWSAGLPSPRDGIRQRQRNILYLQRTVGNHVVRRLVGDMVQRQTGGANAGPNVETLRRFQAQRRQETLAILDSGGVRALRQYLVGLSYSALLMLGRDPQFLDALEARMNAYDAFRMRAILSFGPDYTYTIPGFTDFLAAARDRDYARLSRLIAQDNDLRYPGLRTAAFISRATGTSEEHAELLMRRPPREAPATPEAIVQHQVDLEVALDARDPIQFLQRLRGLPNNVREELNNDLEFLLRIDTTFRRETLFMIRALLEFGTDQPDYVRFFQMALAGPDYERLTDLLRSYPELTQRLPYATRALEWSLPRTPEARAVLAVAHQIHGQREEGEASSVGAHYDTEDPQDPSTPVSLQVFGGTRHFTVERTGTEIRVTVRIAIQREEGVRMLDPDEEQDIRDPIRRWHQGIEERWNGQFIAFNRASRLPVVFVPVFNVTDDPHYTVLVHGDPDYRPNMSNWPINASGRTAAHEFGHMVGNPDEYNLPGTMAEIPDEMGLTPEQEARSSMEGLNQEAQESGEDRQHDLPTLMGTGSDVEERYGWPVLDYFNANMLAPGEDPYRLVLARDLPH